MHHGGTMSMDSLSKGTTPLSPPSAFGVEYNVELQASIRVGHTSTGDTYIDTDANLYSGNDSADHNHYRQITATYTEPDDETEDDDAAPRDVYDTAFDAMGRTNKSIAPLEESHDMEYDEIAAGSYRRRSVRTDGDGVTPYSRASAQRNDHRISMSNGSDDLNTPRPREHVESVAIGIRNGKSNAFPDTVSVVDTLSLPMSVLDVPKRKNYRASDPNIEPVDYDTFKERKSAEIAIWHKKKYSKYLDENAVHTLDHTAYHRDINGSDHRNDGDHGKKEKQTLSDLNIVVGTNAITERKVLPDGLYNGGNDGKHRLMPSPKDTQIEPSITTEISELSDVEHPTPFAKAQETPPLSSLTKGMEAHSGNITPLTHSARNSLNANININGNMMNGTEHHLYHHEHAHSHQRTASNLSNLSGAHNRYNSNPLAMMAAVATTGHARWDSNSLLAAHGQVAGAMAMGWSTKEVSKAELSKKELSLFYNKETLDKYNDFEMNTYSSDSEVSNTQDLVQKILHRNLTENTFTLAATPFTDAFEDELQHQHEQRPEHAAGGQAVTSNINPNQNVPSHSQQSSKSMSRKRRKKKRPKYSLEEFMAVELEQFVMENGDDHFDIAKAICNYFDAECGDTDTVAIVSEANHGPNTAYWSKGEYHRVEQDVAGKYIMVYRACKAVPARVKVATDIFESCVRGLCIDNVHSQLIADKLDALFGEGCHVSIASHDHFEVFCRYSDGYICESPLKGTDFVVAWRR